MISHRNAALVALALSLAGCGWRKQHLIPEYGASVRGAFVAQGGEARPPAPPATGLDSQEAAIIAESYRKSLARKGDKPADQPVIVLQPPAREQREALAPSVPKS